MARRTIDNWPEDEYGNPLPPRSFWELPDDGFTYFLAFLGFGTAFGGYEVYNWPVFGWLTKHVFSDTVMAVIILMGVGATLRLWFGAPSTYAREKQLYQQVLMKKYGNSPYF